MGVMKTDEWLKQLLASDGNAITAHKEIICTPIISFFKNVTAGEIQFELFRQGLFKPDEIGIVEQFLSKPYWKIVEREYNRLRKLWNGPDTAVIILPITKSGPQKNGVAYRKALVLFFTTKIKKVELKALLAHEYNHVCRLACLQKSPDETSLLDSLIIEGLGEYAVEQLYGEQYLSPWTKRYSMKQLDPIWKKYFIPNLQIKGVTNHREFLFGNRSMPPWIGYCIGYRIVQSFATATEEKDVATYLSIPSNQILENSSFNID